MYFSPLLNLLLLILRQNVTLEFKQDCTEIENIFVHSKKKKHGELSLNSNFSGWRKGTTGYMAVSTGYRGPSCSKQGG